MRTKQKPQSHIIRKFKKGNKKEKTLHKHKDDANI